MPLHKIHTVMEVRIRSILKFSQFECRWMEEEEEEEDEED